MDSTAIVNILAPKHILEELAQMEGTTHFAHEVSQDLSRIGFSFREVAFTEVETPLHDDQVLVEVYISHTPIRKRRVHLSITRSFMRTMTLPAGTEVMVHVHRTKISTFVI